MLLLDRIGKTGEEYQTATFTFSRAIGRLEMEEA